MSDNSSRSPVARWPFFLGNALMLAAAALVHYESRPPMTGTALALICGCVAFGTLLGILPFLFAHRVELRRAETETLANAVARIQNLEDIARQIALATSQWQTVQEHANKAAAAAGEIGERMTREAKAFAEFMRQANDTEKATLRLEVEKLHRAENDWLQAVIHMLDHTHALHGAAARSGKTALIQQLTQFQNHLREAARRVGLVPVTVEPGEAFDPGKHHFAGAEQPPAGAPIEGLVATGFSFRGKIIRPPLVHCAAAPAEAPAEAGSAAPAANPAPPPAAAPAEPRLL